MAQVQEQRLLMSGVHDNQTAWRWAAWIAALYCVVLGGMLVFGHVTTRQLDPLKSPELKLLKQQLRSSPRDEALKERIRQLDLQLRKTYFHQLARKETGIWLLLGGAVVFVISLNQTRRARTQLPALGNITTSLEMGRSRSVARFGVAAAACALAAGFAVLALVPRRNLPEDAAAVDKLLRGNAIAESQPPVSIEEYRRNWPRFLGPNGNGHALNAKPPISWDVASGAGILWKSPVPVSGFNSPLIWGERVFFSGGDTNKREVVCVDLKSGQTLWRKAVNTPAAGTPPEIPESTGYAPCTMATDGRRVYAIFANGELGAFSLDGAAVWAKNFGSLANPYGHAISLATYKDRLIVQLDQGESEQGKSRLYSFDGPTGNVVWQKPRQLGASWASPVVFEAAGGVQILTLSLPLAIAYAAEDGTELWRAECLNGEVTPSPIFAGGVAFVASPTDRLLAIKPDGRGDVTKTHVLWTSEEDVPDVTSPASDGELVFTLSTSGLLIAYDAKDGKKQWSHDFEMEFHASPAIAGGHVYLFSQKGDAFVVQAAREFKQVAHIPIPDSFHASPAFVNDRIVVRGMTNLWCLGAVEVRVAQP